MIAVIGIAVHIGFGAHGMSGVTKGPDGRIWWGIGDIGMNVIDKEGKVRYAEVLDNAGELPNFEAVKATLAKV